MNDVMTLRKRVEKLESAVSGGFMTDESRYNYAYMCTLYNTARATDLALQWKYNKRLNPACYQKHYPRFEQTLQLASACYIRFRMLPIISLSGTSYGEETDGSFYIGDVSGQRSYWKVKDRTSMSNANGHRFMKVNGRKMEYLIDGSLNLVEVYGNTELETVLEECVFADPRMVNTYNEEYDAYPIDEATADRCEKALIATTTSIIASTNPDYISNGTDLMAQINNVRQQVIQRFNQK